MFYRKFLFGQDSGTADVIGVSAGDLYRPGKGYGFVAEKNRQEQERLRIPELNSAFDTVYWYRNADLSFIRENSTGCFLNSEEEIERLEALTGEKMEGERRRIPLSFKVDVPRQGNYKVTVVIRTGKPMKDVLIFTGRRRLGYRGNISSESAMEQQGNVPEEIVFRHTMMVNVCDIIPRGHTKRFEDKTLDITILAEQPKFSEVIVEEDTCPTLYIAGDSTVTDQSAEYP